MGAIYRYHYSPENPQDKYATLSCDSAESLRSTWKLVDMVGLLTTSLEMAEWGKGNWKYITLKRELEWERERWIKGNENWGQNRVRDRVNEELVSHSIASVNY